MTDICTSRIAFSAVFAPVADCAHAAGLTFFAEIRPMQLLRCNRIAKVIIEQKLHRFPLIVHAGKMRLSALERAALNVIELFVLDEAPAGAAENKCDIVLLAFLPQQLYPFKIAGAGAVIVFAVADHALDLSGAEILPQADTPDKRRTHHALVLERQLQQNRDAFICAALILSRYVEKDILPAVAPIRRQTFCDPFGTLCQQEEYDIASCADDIPRIGTPRISLLEEEIRGHADADHLAAFDFILTGAFFLQRIVEAGFGAVDLRAVAAAHLVKKVHIAVVAALALADAAVPRIPDIMH